MEIKYYASLENLQLYDELIKETIAQEDAKSLKTVALSSDGKKFLFYRVEEPVGTTAPAYEIELPEMDTSECLKKLVGATPGNIVVVDSNGGIKDSLIKLSALALTSEVDTKIATAISQASHLKKTVVTTLPLPSEADDNTFYLIKDSSATGADKYLIYTKIDNTMVLIDDTSVNLDNYYTKDQTDGKITTAKEEASADAQAKADKALSDAKTEINKTNANVTAVGDRVTANDNKITNLTSNVNENSDRLTALESSMGEGMVPISADTIRAMFG